MYCKNCGAPMDANAAVCTKCGVAAGNGSTYCPNCGQTTDAHASVCSPAGTGGVRGAPQLEQTDAWASVV